MYYAMKAFEFQTRVTSDGKLAVQNAFFEEVQRMQEVRVIVFMTNRSERSKTMLTQIYY